VKYSAETPIFPTTAMHGVHLPHFAMHRGGDDPGPELATLQKKMMMMQVV